MHPARSSRSDKRLRHIDSLRAVAALLVVWRHVSDSYLGISPATAQSHWVHDVASLAGVGVIGVSLFFAISGFVIPFSIRPDGPAPVRDFLLRRAFRIFPLYWLSIPFGALTTQIMWGSPFTLQDMLLDMTLLQYFFEWPTAMGLYWTLAVEMLFYAACALLLFARSINNHGRIAVIAMLLLGAHLVAVELYRDGYFAPSSYRTSLWFLRLSIMFWGALYRAWWEGKLVGRFANGCMWGLLAVIVVAYPLLCGLRVGFPLDYYLPYSLALVIFVIGTTAVELSWRPLVWMGKVSYSIYLLHPIVFMTLLGVLHHADVNSWWRTRHLGTYVVVNILLTLLVAGIVYRFVEHPAIELGRRLSTHLFGGRKQGVTEAI